MSNGFKSFRKLLLLLSGMGFLFTLSCEKQKDREENFRKDLEKSVVLVRVTKQPPKGNTPWLWKRLSTEYHLGTVVTPPGMGKHILMTAWALTFHKDIAMLRYGSSRPDHLKPAYIDYNSNLALLKPVNEEALEGMQPVRIGPDQAPGTSISLFTDFNNLRITGYSGHISAAGVFESPTSSYQIPNYLLKVDKKSLGWSEPVFSEKELVALTSGQDQDFIYALPSLLIRHALQDYARSALQKSGGFPGTGLLTQALVSPGLRESLGVPATGPGSRIALVEAGSPFFGKVQVNDVLLEAEGQKIDDRQTFVHPVWGSIPWVVIYNQLYAGDPMTITISRQGKKMTFTEKLPEYDSNKRLIRQYSYEDPPPFLIYAGLVIQELSLDYLKTWGRYWEQEAKSALLYQWNYQNKDQVPEKRILLLTRVLSDEINTGYDSFTNMVVEKVNGLTVHTIADLEIALNSPVEQHGVNYGILTLSMGKGEIILFHDQVLAAQKRISGQYNILPETPFFQQKNHAKLP